MHSHEQSRRAVSTTTRTNDASLALPNPAISHVARYCLVGLLRSFPALLFRGRYLMPLQRERSVSNASPNCIGFHENERAERVLIVLVGWEGISQRL